MYLPNNLYESHKYDIILRAPMKTVITTSREQEVIELLNNDGFLKGLDNSTLVGGLGFHEFDLADIGLPPIEEMRAATDALINEVGGLVGWSGQGTQYTDYKGISLTHNPDFGDKSASVFSQTLGSSKLTQSYSRLLGHEFNTATANTYYDSLGFRAIHPVVSKHYATIFDSINCAISRSRIACLFPDEYSKRAKVDGGWHIDEYPHILLRLNIPVHTSSDHVLQINGVDEFGNKLELEKHLKAGKAYVWNTRIPHRVHTESSSSAPRTHIVLGLLPYLTYNQGEDSFSKSDNYGMPMNEFVKNMKWVNRG